MDLLEKSKKDRYLQMFKGQEEVAKPVVEWTAKTLPNENHAMWFLRNYKKNPSSFTPEVKANLEHYSGMMHLPEVSGVRFESTHDLNYGINAFKEAENKALSKETEGLVDPKGKKIIDLGNGFGWWNLGVSICKKEGKAMKHCGNESSVDKKDRIYSLRQEVGNKLKPHLTFINNQGYLTQTKGKANTKPKKEYHNAVIKLLQHPNIKGVVGGGYLPGTNFEQDDLTEEQRNLLLKQKPNLFSPNLKDLPESIKKDPFLSFTVVKDEEEDDELDLDLSNLDLEAQHKLVDKYKYNYKKRQALATNPNLHLEVQHELSRDGDEVKKNLAKNPNLHPEVQHKLFDYNYGDRDAGTRASLAENPNLHPEVQHKLAGDRDSFVLEALALNPNLLPELQHKLLYKSHYFSRSDSLTRNPNLLPELQHQIANYDDKSFREGLAKNPNLLPELQHKLSNDSNEIVKRDLASNLNLLPKLQHKLSNDSSERVRRRLAYNPNLHPEVQHKLANDSNYYVREGLAENLNVLPELQYKLAGDGYKNVRELLALNPNLLPEVAKTLEKKLRETIEAAQENNQQSISDAQSAASSLQTLRKNQLIQKLKHKDTDINFLNRYKNSHNKDVKNAAREGLKNKSSLTKSEKLKKSSGTYKHINKNDLKKVYSVNGKFYPEKKDTDGTKHPDKPQIKTTDHKGKAVWRYNQELSKKMESDFVQNYKKNIHKYSPNAQKLITSLASKIAKDPHRHNITTEIDDDGREHFMRLRHLSYALAGKPGYSIEDLGDKIKINAERHKDSTELHTWHYDGKDLKFLRKTPIGKSKEESNDKKSNLGSINGRTKENSNESRRGSSGGEVHTGIDGKRDSDRNDSGRILSKSGDNWRVKSEAYFNMDLLEKSKKDRYLQMFKGQEEVAKPVVEWTAKTLPNENHAMWFLRNYKKNPSSFTPEVKTNLEHYSGMMHLPEVSQVRFESTHDLNHGINAFKEAENKALSKETENLVDPKGEKVIDVGNGFGWWDLGTNYCKEEGKAMKHCGNKSSVDKKERIYSLRQEIGNKLRPHLTFINNQGYLTQTKGKANTKPKKEYHNAVIKLLQHPNIKGVVGGGYLPGTNFEQDDLTEEQKKSLLAQKPNLFSPNLKDLPESIKKDPFLSFTVVKDEEEDNLDLKTQHKLANHNNEFVRWGLASNPNLHPELQHKLAGDSDRDVRGSLAKNPNLLQEVQHKLANDSNNYVRSQLAKNPNLHPELQHKLSNDSDNDVRGFLAKNHNLLPELQHKLAGDSDRDVRGFLASNPNLFPELQHKLANDRNNDVRQALATNPNLHLEVQHKLANDSDNDVRGFLAKNPNLHPELQHKLANDSDNNVRQGLASNPNLHLEVQHKLANDSDKTVKLDLVYNPNLHPEAAKTLEKKLREIIEAAQENNQQSISDAQKAAISLQTLRKNQLVQKLKHKDTDINFLNRYKNSHNKDVKNAAREGLKNKSSLTKSEKLRKSSGWKVKIKGLDGWQKVKNIKDLGPNNGNNYELEDGRVFHQSLIEDIDMSSKPSDPWDKAKYDRGGEKEFLNYKEPTSPFKHFQELELPDNVVKFKHLKKTIIPKDSQQVQDIANKVVEQINTYPLYQNSKNKDWVQNHPYPENDANKSLKNPSLTKMYRSYKNSPHNPLSLALKYTIHRIENIDKYNDHSMAQKLDDQFMDHHYHDKNEKLSIHHLHKFIEENPSIVHDLISHKKSLNNLLLNHAKNRIHTIDGEPHIALTRGLDVTKVGRGPDHALASYADVPDTGFGTIMHHQYVPLKNVWYSYDLGPKEASSDEFGTENEWLVSPHKIKYRKDSGDETKMLAPREHHKHEADDFFKAVAGNANNVKDIDSWIEKDPITVMQGLSEHLQPHHIDKLIDYDPFLSSKHLGHKMTPEHVDKVFNKEMTSAAKNLSDKLSPSQIDYIFNNAITADKAGGGSYFKNLINNIKNRLNDQQLEKIVNDYPHIAIENLRDVLKANHIEKLAGKYTDQQIDSAFQKNPNYKEYLQNKNKLAASFNPIKNNSISSLKKSIERLTKSQFTKLDPKLLQLKNEGTALSNFFNKDKAERLLTEGKLNPQDIDTIIENRNLDLNKFLLQRDDLTKEQLNKMISHVDDFDRGNDYRRRDSAKEFNIDAFKKIKGLSPDYMDHLVDSGNSDSIRRSLMYAPNDINGSHLFNISTKRHDLDESVLESLSAHPSFDSGHGIELIKHPNEDVAFSTVLNLSNNKKLEPNVLNSALADRRHSLVKNILKEDSINISQNKIKELLSHESDEVKAEAAGRANDPELIDYIINNLQNNPNHKNIFENLVSGSNLGFKNKKVAKNTEQLDKLTDYSLSKHPDLLKDRNFWAEKDLSPETMKKIARSLLDPDIKKQITHHSNSNSEVIQELLNHDKNHEVMKSVAKSSFSSPEQIRQSWNQADKNAKSYNSSDITEWIENENTPEDVINEIAGNENKFQLSSAFLSKLLSRPDLNKDNVNKYLSHENPEVRRLMATNPSLSPDQISQGLKDKKMDVRASFLQRSDLGPEHFDLALKDRAPSNRKIAVSHPNMPSEILHKFITNDKDEGVRLQASGHDNLSPKSINHIITNEKSDVIKNNVLNHKNLTAEILETFLQNPTSQLAIKLAGNDNLRPDQAKKLMSAAANAHNDSDNYSEKRSLKHALFSLMKKNKADQGFNENILLSNKELAEYAVFSDSGIRDDLSHDFLNKVYDKYPEHIESLLDHPKANAAGIIDRAILDHEAHEDISRTMRRQENLLTPEQQARLAGSSNHSGVISQLLNNSNTHGDTLKTIYDRFKDDPNNAYRIESVASHQNTPQELLEQLSNHGNGNIRYSVASNLAIPDHLVDKLLKDPEKSVRKEAGKRVALSRPDIYNSSLDGAHEVYIHPHTEKFKHLKGLVQSMGGKINKKDLPPQYKNLGQLLDGQGNMTDQSIDKYIHELPKTKYNVSYSSWDGAQMHDDGVSGPQKVLQLNLTNNHIQELKNQGLLETFKKLYNSSSYSGHPVDKHSLGWARIDESHPGHMHFDEFQSDLSRGAINQIERAKEDGSMSPEEATKHSEDIKKIIKIVSHPFKNINHAIMAAAHSVARDKGITSTSMDLIEDQAKQSGMNIEKGLPGHMQQTYKQFPEDIGYETKLKKEIMPNTKAPENEFQFRKLIKSYSAFKFLRK